MAGEEQTNHVELATELTIAWLSNANNRVAADDVPTFLGRMHETLTKLGTGGNTAEDLETQTHVAAVTARKSLASPDVIISLIDGKPYKSLKRHLSRHGLTPQQYRERYNLKPDYPMVAPSYAKQRRDLALSIGLGSKGRAARAEKRESTSAAAAAPKKRGRKPAAKPAAT